MVSGMDPPGGVEGGGGEHPPTGVQTQVGGVLGGGNFYKIV